MRSEVGSERAAPVGSGVEVLDDALAIARYCRRDLALYLYQVGDLDPFFWPHTRWYGRRDARGQLAALALLYRGSDPPTLLAFASEPERASTAALLAELEPQLPERLYAHLSPGLDAAFGSRRLQRHGRHLKMELSDVTRLAAVEPDPRIVALTEADEPQLTAFYRESYPDNWFDRRMLLTGQYLAFRDGERLLSVAGVHVYSPRYRVAALGNITTSPSVRGQGLACRVTAALCRQLLESVDVIGLNVAADNAAAVACYRRLGFFGGRGVRRAGRRRPLRRSWCRARG